MYRHELRFVLRFGVRVQFDEIARRLLDEETARGLSAPRFWRATSGQVNQIVIVHDHATADAFRAERAAFHDDPGAICELLAGLSELAVPGTAIELEYDGLEPAAGGLM
jgi:hypothetical protein